MTVADALDIVRDFRHRNARLKPYPAFITTYDLVIQVYIQDGYTVLVVAGGQLRSMEPRELKKNLWNCIESLHTKLWLQRNYGEQIVIQRT